MNLNPWTPWLTSRENMARRTSLKISDGRARLLDKAEAIVRDGPDDSPHVRGDQRGFDSPDRIEPEPRASPGSRDRTERNPRGRQYLGLGAQVSNPN